MPPPLGPGGDDPHLPAGFALGAHLLRHPNGPIPPSNQTLPGSTRSIISEPSTTSSSDLGGLLDDPARQVVQGISKPLGARNSVSRTSGLLGEFVETEQRRGALMHAYRPTAAGRRVAGWLYRVT